MSRKEETGTTSTKREPGSPQTTKRPEIQTSSNETTTGKPASSLPRHASPETPNADSKIPAATAAAGGAEYTEQTSLGESDEPRPRQVIAVSASKGPAAFFNLARKFLVTDETCDLSALEGAIVAAVDAAHLLERSKLATIIRVQTSYVTVEPKRRKQVSTASQQHAAGIPFDPPIPHGAAVATTLGDQQHTTTSLPSSSPSPIGKARAGGREMRRARIVITVKRTENYKKWLQENPVQAMMAGDGGDEIEDQAAGEH